MEDELKDRDQLIRELREAREKAEFFQELVDSMDEGVQVVRADGTIKWSNRATIEKTGYTAEEWAAMDVRALYEPEDLQRIAKVLLDFYTSPEGTTIRASARVRVKDGSRQLLDVSMVHKPNPPFEGSIGVIRVVGEQPTEPRQYDFSAEKQTPYFEFSARDETLGTIFNNVRDALIVHDLDGKIEYLNRAAMEMFGLSPAQAVAASSADRYYGPESRGDMFRSIWKRVSSGEPERYEWRLSGSADMDGRDVEVFMRSIRVDDTERILAVVSDITDRKEAERKIKASLAEKEALLREVHHRVKNNFSVMTSLLRMQERRIKDEGMRRMIRETRFRVGCMGFVHEKLHQSESLTELRISDYLRSLVTNLAQSYSAADLQIAVDVHIEDAKVSPDAALSLGFITSELVSNAFKHAFPGGGPGGVTVRLARRRPEELELTVKDDGVGIASDLDIDSLHSLGLNLVKTFTAQLYGTYDLSNAEGACWRICFPLREFARPN